MDRTRIMEMVIAVFLSILLSRNQKNTIKKISDQRDKNERFAIQTAGQLILREIIKLHIYLKYFK